MRAFVLCTGRCGSHTFAAACESIVNYAVGHESRAGRVAGRFDYPDRHIEVDNRLSWLLGTLDRRYGDDAVYVHLLRDEEAVAQSYARRMRVQAGIMPAFASGVIRQSRPTDVVAAARLMTQTVNDTIRLFLRDKSKVATVPIEDPHGPFDEFWDLIDADGNQAAAHATLGQVHNARRL